MTIRDAILVNATCAVLFLLISGVWAAGALVKSDATTTLTPPSQSVAQTLYDAGRYDLLRDTARECERYFEQVVSTSFRGQVRADWTTALVALAALALGGFNLWFLRKRRD